MTLIVSTITSSGIVLSADSRQTYRNLAGNTRIGSDSAVKLFKLTPKCGVAVAGRAFINESGQAAKDVGYFVRRFTESNELDGLSVADIATALSKYLGGLFIQREKEAIKQVIVDAVAKDGGTDLVIADTDTHLLPYTFKAQDGTPGSNIGWVETIFLIVAGIDSDTVGRAYSLVVPQDAGRGLVKDTQTCGALWQGQTDVLMRIIKGWAPEIDTLAFVHEAKEKDSTQVVEQLNKLEYIINWGTITLQDAVDFCVLVTRTTENIQRFSDGTVLSPGGITGVGGEIDIAIITPEKGFVWLNQKALKASGHQLAPDDDGANR